MRMSARPDSRWGQAGCQEYRSRDRHAELSRTTEARNLGGAFRAWWRGDGVRDPDPGGRDAGDAGGADEPGPAGAAVVAAAGCGVAPCPIGVPAEQAARQAAMTTAPVTAPIRLLTALDHSRRYRSGRRARAKPPAGQLALRSNPRLR
jgi:hypothetical protein